MDPKNIQNLDPKLKEIYERVMGTPTNHSIPTPPPPSPTQTTPITPSGSLPVPPTSSPTPPAAAQPAAPPPTPIPNPSAKTQTFVAHNTVPINPRISVNSAIVTPAKSKKLSLPILILGIIAFIVAYAFFWIKIFNFQLPFLG